MRGFVGALGSTDHVASPSFMISKEYTAGGLRIVHFDFYRLQDPGHIADALAEATHDDKTVILIEWADIVESVLPDQRTVITFQLDKTDKDARIIEINALEPYLLEGFKT